MNFVEKSPENTSGPVLISFFEIESDSNKNNKLAFVSSYATASLLRTLNPSLFICDSREVAARLICP